MGADAVFLRVLFLLLIASSAGMAFFLMRVFLRMGRLMDMLEHMERDEGWGVRDHDSDESYSRK
jgi:hypothetical protein